MGQPSLFLDVDKQLATISAKGDPLETIDKAVPWGELPGADRGGHGDQARGQEEQRRPAGLRHDPEVQDAGAAVALQSVRRALEIQVRDRLSFMRFLGLDLNAPVPDATTIWLFREALVEADKIGALFALYKQHLEAKGFIAR